MNAYDFDKTIFPRDSTATFYLWCLRRCPRALLSLPQTAFAFALLGLKLREKTRCKEIFYGFLRHIPADAPVRFWQEHLGQIYPWYSAQKRADDIIISASPEFLLRPAAEALGVALIASRVDPRSGKTEGLNCHGEEKVRRFRALYPDAAVEEFYSDSLSDTPMARQAARAFLIVRGAVTDWPAAEAKNCPKNPR